jgi:hypothetical protein
LDGTFGEAQKALLSNIRHFEPDVLVVDLVWFLAQSLMDRIGCPTVLLMRSVTDAFLEFASGEMRLRFDASEFDLVVSIEPHAVVGAGVRTEPLVLRNPDELLSREEAAGLLELRAQDRNCLILQNGEPGEFSRLAAAYSYLEDAGYRVYASTNFDQQGVFPAVEYYNAFDFIVTGAGYNSFWECVFLDKEAVFVPMPRVFEDQRERVETCSDYHFEVNGADQLVRLLREFG